MALTREVDPISRIEGHLGVKLTVASGGDGGAIPDGHVSQADVHGNLWRGFENFLIGRHVNDAITFTQRICGVCPVPHGQAATNAADNVLGYNDSFQTWVTGGTQLSSTDGTSTVPVPGGQGIPAKAVHIRNLVLSAEFLMSHLTHSYHLAAPSYVQGPNIPPWTPYFDDNFYHPKLKSTGHGVAATTNANQPAQAGSTLPLDDDGFSKDLWSAVIKQYVKALRIRRLTFEAGALFAGRMPMTSCYVAGGVTTDSTEVLTTKCNRYRSIMQEIGEFIIKEFVPLFLALGALYPDYDNVNNDALAVAAGLGPVGTCKGYGSGVGNYLSWGAFPQTGGTLGFARGYKVGLAGTIDPITKAGVYANLREHIKHSRYAGSVTSLDPTTGAAVVVAQDTTDPATELRTVPKRDSATKYSWLKAPRWNGAPMEVGPMARMFVATYYQNNVELATSIPTGGGIKGYDYYVKSFTRGDASVLTGLDPKMVAADVAVALVREGLATLTLGGATPGGDVVVDATYLAGVGVDNAAIVAAYTAANAVITGTVAAWVYGLKAGASTMDRLRARPLESYVLIQLMIGTFTKGFTVSWAGGGWIGALDALGTAATYTQKLPTAAASGFGATEAPRGALMHMCSIDKAGKILRYQCIVPTTWNASPKDASETRGPIEQAMIGIPYSTQQTTATGGAGTAITAGGGVEALRVAQSFDPCIACAVH